MSKDVVKHMTEYIEDKERENQANKIASESQAKTDIVKNILNELERVMKDEN